MCELFNHEIIYKYKQPDVAYFCLAFYFWIYKVTTILFIILTSCKLNVCIIYIYTSEKNPTKYHCKALCCCLLRQRSLHKLNFSNNEFKLWQRFCHLNVFLKVRNMSSMSHVGIFSRRWMLERWNGVPGSRANSLSVEALIQCAVALIAFLVNPFSIHTPANVSCQCQSCQQINREPMSFESPLQDLTRAKWRCWRPVWRHWILQAGRRRGTLFLTKTFNVKWHPI